MKSDIEDKLRKIQDVWNNFIVKSKCCRNEVKFAEDMKSNYLGVILGYFRDTHDIIFTKRDTETLVDRFSYHMSLLQAIYIQQDFIEELLIIFKCNINKGKLKKDENFFINREIRNELVGHPIRKIIESISSEKADKIESCGSVVNSPKNKSVLLSATLLSCASDNNTIQYLRYHKDNDYQSEVYTCPVADIIQRHKQFLNCYFDIIIKKLIGIFKKYDNKLLGLTKMIENQSFEIVIKRLDFLYESIYSLDYAYDKDSLISIYNKKSEHERYQNFIDEFYSDLKNGLEDTRNYIQEFIEPKSTLEDVSICEEGGFFENLEKGGSNNSVEKEETHDYELGKIANNRDARSFESFSGTLKTKYSDNKLIMDEFKHMENNIDNEIEYYTAYKLICKEIGEIAYLNKQKLDASRGEKLSN